MQSLISIIVPVYNVEKFLNKCLDSISNQTYTNFECILINDGSTDNSFEICKIYEAQDNRFFVLTQNNSGPSIARNAGLDKAKGDYVAFVDSDDWIERNFLETQLADLIKYDGDIAICGFVEKHCRNIKLLNREQAIRTLFYPVKKSFSGYIHNKIYKMELFNELRFKPEIQYLEDLELNYRIFNKCKKIVWTNTPLYNYRDNEESITKQIGLTPQAKTGIIALKEMYENEKNKSIKKNILENKITFCMGKAVSYLIIKNINCEEYRHLSKKIREHFIFALLSFNIKYSHKILLFLIAFNKDPSNHFFINMLRTRIVNKN